MRSIFRALCAVALAGCSDVQTPVESKTPTLTATDPAVEQPDANGPKNGIDSRPVIDRIDALFTGQVGRVSIPADGFSKFADAVHPDIACPPDTWNGGECWILYTPYRNSNPLYENPALLLTTTDTSWVTPPQVSNPLIPYPGAPAYNSDPDHAFDPTTRRMVQVYRVVADSFNKIMLMSTADTKQWTSPVVAFKERNHDAVSPALLLEQDRTAKLWYVRAGQEGCAAASSSVHLRMAWPDADGRYEHSTWTEGMATNLTIPGYVPWHLDVIELPDGRGYLAMIAAYQKFSSCASSDVWLATSPDGVAWRTFNVPLFWRTMKAAKQFNLSTWYRGTMRYNSRNDVIDFWPSGMANAIWSVYHTSAKLSDLLALLELAKPGDFHPPAVSNRATELTTIQMP